MTQLSMLDPVAHARRSDPDTSHQAARTLSPEALRGSQAFVLSCLRTGPQTDHDIARCAWMETRYSPSRLRTARHELVRNGVVRWTGRTERIERGIHSTHARIWEIVP